MLWSSGTNASFISFYSFTLSIVSRCFPLAKGERVATIVID